MGEMTEEMRACYFTAGGHREDTIGNKFDILTYSILHLIFFQNINFIYPNKNTSLTLVTFNSMIISFGSKETEIVQENFR